MDGIKFNAGTYPNIQGMGFNGGALALFDKKLRTYILSSSESALNGIQQLSNGGYYQSGVMGSIKTIPQGFTFSTILYAGEYPGVNNAMMGWGSSLLKMYGKKRVPTDDQNMLKYLGYSTTAYYFYNPAYGNNSTGNYEKTLLDVHEYASLYKVPYGYYLIDSWWYGEYTIYHGIWMWEDSHILLKDRFPNGLTSLNNKLGGVPYVAHMGMWVPSSPYVSNSSYKFIVDGKGAVPQDQSFWEYIFRKARSWGLQVVKQDHISTSYNTIKDLYLYTNAQEDWLMNQGHAAYNHDIKIMYCMDRPAVILNSVRLPSVTSSRAGNDYTPDGAAFSWDIGTTSMNLYSLGLWPFKDSFYSSSSESVSNPNSKFYQFREPYPGTHALCATLSAGGVAPGDGEKLFNKELIMRSCRTDGLLLKPDRPAIPIEQTWLEKAFNMDGPYGTVHVTYTSYNTEYRWDYIVGIGLKQNYTFEVKDLMDEGMIGVTRPSMVVFEYNRNDHVQITPVEFSNDKPFHIGKAEGYDYRYYIVSPVLPNNWVVLGEVDKWVTVSKQRIVSIAIMGTAIDIMLSGEANEDVRIMFMDPEGELYNILCNVGPSGTAQLIMHTSKEVFHLCHND
eukprot:TRINITY_DN1998_c0_g1_i1.p1 TRINITY_DN1998_c0_g1~~TRINITY_DN1998_c0_g1_i1.p1  ORF type:complete len:615 (+),score=103.10 TRINITY_DN1998_c0_g1_i1:302-2146(+)